MPRRCELCGAKARPSDETCRECASPLTARALDPFESAADITAVESAASDWTHPGNEAPLAQTHPEIHFEDPRPRRRAPLVAVMLGVAVAVGVGAVAYTRLDTKPASTATADETVPAPATPGSQTTAAPGCPELLALDGHWTFTTEVTGSRVVQSNGLNGFYTLDVDVQGCVASGALTKTGYTARMFSEERLQRASATLESGRGVREGFASAAFQLESKLGAYGIVEFSFAAQGDTLSGVYRQRGSRWRDAGLTGFLRGVRDGDSPRELVAAEQPCSTRCHLACDTAVRDALAPPAFDSCVQGCSEDANEAAHCGDAQPVPDAYVLPLEGPGSLAKLCRGIGGCAKTIGRGHEHPPSLAAERLPKGWSDVKMLRANKEGGVRIALHGPGGWWLSAPVFDAPRNTRLGKLRLYARQLAEGIDRRYVLGLARTDTREDSPEVFFACRLEETPRCVRVAKARGAQVNALPEGTLSVAPSAGDPSGVFAW